MERKYSSKKQLERYSKEESIEEDGIYKKTGDFNKYENNINEIYNKKSQTNRSSVSYKSQANQNIKLKQNKNLSNNLVNETEKSQIDQLQSNSLSDNNYSLNTVSNTHLIDNKNLFSVSIQRLFSRQ